MPSSLNRADFQQWIGNGTLIYENYAASSNNLHETRIIDVTSGATSRWPADLRLFLDPITRDGSHYAYTYPDPSGRGFIFIQETSDISGARRRQVTGLPPPP